MTRNALISITVFLAALLCMLATGCGGDQTKLTANLGQTDEAVTTAAGQQANPGSVYRVNPDNGNLRAIPPADPWAMPELVYPTRGASSVSPAAISKMEGILDEELRKYGKSRDKTTAKAPTGSTNAAFDVSAAAAGSPITGVELSWTERVIGDYDVNGEVNVADLTPIALNFGGTPAYDLPGDHGGIAYWPTGDPDAGGAANWRLAGVDGDDNGEINLGDISPIAVHFGERIDGFRIYRRLDGEGTFSLLANPTNPGLAYTVSRPVVGNGAPARYFFDDAGTTSGNVEYYVATFDATTGTEGPVSNTASVQLSQGPTADLNSDVTSGSAPLTVNFDAINSVDPDGTITKYEFDFGEGTGFEDFGTTNLATHEYSDLGTFTAVLRVTDNDANTDTDSLIITTSGQSPVADLIADQTFGDVPLVVNFDASASFDPDGTIDKVEFDFDNGTGYQERPLLTDFTFAVPGSFTVLLRLTDNDGLEGFGQINITVVNPGDLVLPPLWEVAKTNAGVSGSSMGFAELLTWDFDVHTWGGGFTDLFTMLPAFYDAWYLNPEGAPGYMAGKANDLEAAGDLQALFLEANSEFQTEHIIVEQSWQGAVAGSDELANAIADFVTGVGGTPDFATYQAALAALGQPEQEALAGVVYGALNAYEGRDASVRAVFGDIDDPDTRDLFNTYFDLAHGYGLWALAVDTTNFPFGMLLPQGDGGPNFFRHYPYTARNLEADSALFEGSAQLLDSIDDLTAFVNGSPTFADVSLDVDTPAGRITIGGTGDDVHGEGPGGNGHAILFDLGGNDTYDSHAGGTASSYNGVAVCIDLGGNDIYNNIDDPDDFDRSVGWSDDDTSQQGAGRFGTGVLVDYGGADDYTGIRMCQGVGIWGVGVLADYGTGDDVYDVEAFGQGAAMAGIGLLFDEDGGDGYSCFHKAQGFGGPEGVGYLVDRGMGVDTYYAEPVGDPGKPEYDATEVYGTNMNIAQGCGWGSRWGWIELSAGEDSWSVIMSGGQGVLYDGGGDDTYSCGTFGMGMGFYQGMGLLLDADGSDNHFGHWYTQGATAHAAVGGVLDMAGNDSWENEVSIGIGGAHDMSVTWFLELLGDDTYDASALAVGTGYSNGFGYFIDYGGVDTYNSTYSTGATDNLGIGKLGDANRPTWPSYGIFVDQGGQDVYDTEYLDMEDSDGPPGNNKEWTRIIPFASDPPVAEDNFGRGAGVDGI